MSGYDYTVILADPPWRYAHSVSKGRRIENHYPTMALDEICKLRVANIAASDAVLFLWATAPKLPEALQVMSAWGFEYKTQAVWDKEMIGMGYYFRGQHELLLIGTRGKLSTPPQSARVSSVIRSRRTKHSQKPAIVYEIIERMYPGVPRIELFARNTREGWDCWGNEV